MMNQNKSHLKVKTNIKVRKRWGINPITNIIKSKKGRIKHMKRFWETELDN